MKIRWIGIGMAAVWVAAGAYAGSLDSPAGPTEPGSAMYRLEDVYNRLDTGAPGAQSVFAEPGAGPGSTGHTLNEVMAKAPATNASAAVGGDVLDGRCYWCLNVSSWGPMTGTMTNRMAVTITPATNQQSIAQGYHNGAGYVVGDTDLASSNIVSGVTIFGVLGSASIASGPPAQPAKTGQTTTFATADDGDLRRGMPWPSPRFTNSAAGLVKDNLTGLIWLKKANYIDTDYPDVDADGTLKDGRVTWQHALDFVLGMNAGTYTNFGRTDWRLPNVRELNSLIDYGRKGPALCNTAGTGQWAADDPFDNVENASYWTGTTYADDSNNAWRVSLDNGYAQPYSKTGQYFSVWPVCGP